MAVIRIGIADHICAVVSGRTVVIDHDLRMDWACVQKGKTAQSRGTKQQGQPRCHDCQTRVSGHRRFCNPGKSAPRQERHTGAASDRFAVKIRALKIRALKRAP
ncbi:hypothetical protein EN856_22475 [Mesorhizobium sp. M8A.F.Ca.ET.213.01.1.1]|nr:hypothetical protein EN856_22475 [Mesorhizobium sp. M8A.F.Ca.ET.213.01.1.1]